MSALVTSEARPDFYTVGGTIPPRRPDYVARAADDQLERAVHNGEFCYVLTPRQMGKSSLMVRLAYRLRKHRMASAIVDLTIIGTTDLPVEAWYLGQLKEIVRGNTVDWRRSSRRRVVRDRLV